MRNGAGLFLWELIKEFSLWSVFLDFWWDCQECHIWTFSNATAPVQFATAVLVSVHRGGEAPFPQPWPHVPPNTARLHKWCPLLQLLSSPLLIISCRHVPKTSTTKINSLHRKIFYLFRLSVYKPRKIASPLPSPKTAFKVKSTTVKNVHRLSNEEILNAKAYFISFYGIYKERWNLMLYSGLNPLLTFNEIY